MPRRIVYHPPSREVIDAYARRVCQRLAERYGTSIYTDAEVVWGLSRFLQLSAEILAKHQTAESEQASKKLDSNTK